MDAVGNWVSESPIPSIYDGEHGLRIFEGAWKT